MKIKDYINLSLIKNEEITGLSHDSLTVKKGDIFFALRGGVDGNIFLPDVLKVEASLIVTDSADSYFKYKKIANILLVNDSRKAMSIYAKRYYNNSSDKLKIIGITGTNGKSTSAHFTNEILKKMNMKTALLGTSYNEILGVKEESILTTPDPILLHSFFQKCVEKNVDIVVMEVSAHAIKLAKIYGIKFHAAALTNLASDHLDYFRDLSDYQNTKLSFFLDYKIKSIVINSECKKGINILKENKKMCSSDFMKVSDISSYLTNSDFSYENEKYRVSIIGKENIENLFLAIKIVEKCGINKSQILEVISNINMLKGRFQILENSPKKNQIIVIDYAHTSSSYEVVLKHFFDRKAEKKLIAIISSPGNRDEFKRKEIGEIADKYSDHIIITTDNPMYENPLIIANQVAKNITDHTYEIILDREKAIKKMMKKKNSILLILGKGCEEYQLIDDEKIPYNDEMVVRKYLEN